MPSSATQARNNEPFAGGVGYEKAARWRSWKGITTRMPSPALGRWPSACTQNGHRSHRWSRPHLRWRAPGAATARQPAGPRYWAPRIRTRRGRRPRNVVTGREVRAVIGRSGSAVRFNAARRAGRAFPPSVLRASAALFPRGNEVPGSLPRLCNRSGTGWEKSVTIPTPERPPPNRRAPRRRRSP